MDAEVALRYPQFESLLLPPDTRNYREWPHFASCEQSLGASTWGEADSVFRAFQSYMIELLSKDTNFPETLAGFYDDPPVEQQ